METIKVKCFGCGLPVEVENDNIPGFHFHKHCVTFKSRLTKGQKRKILKNARAN